MKGLSLSVSVPTLTLYTDASNLGWGAYLERSWALGLWSPLQQKEHINLFEMKAVHLALSHFRTTLHLKSLVLATDNTTVVTYLKNQGGIHCFNLYSLCREILLLCSELQIQLVVRHVPGHLNVLAGTLSCSLTPVKTEWELLQVIFNAFSLPLGRPHLDLFATSLNHKLDTFISPVPDPLAYAVDAMSISWKVLQKVARESRKIILIAPCARPLFLPLRVNLLSQLKGRIMHPNPENLHLHAWLLSRRESDRKVVLSEQPTTSLRLSDSLQRLSTMQSGQSSLIGVLDGKLILSKSLHNN
jgi:hypothetical protein